MATSGPNSPGTVTNVDNGGGRAWANPGNAASSNNSYATLTYVDGDGNADFLVAKNFGFSIPSGSTINGITVEIELKTSVSASYSSDSSIMLTKDGSTQIGGDRADFGDYPYPTTDTYKVRGGAADLWDTTWTAEEINSADFGVFYTPYISGAGYDDGDVISVDHIRITVDYTAPAGGHPAMRRYGGTPGMLGAGRIGRSW